MAVAEQVFSVDNVMLILPLSSAGAVYGTYEAFANKVSWILYIAANTRLPKECEIDNSVDVHLEF